MKTTKVELDLTEDWFSELIFSLKSSKENMEKISLYLKDIQKNEKLINKIIQHSTYEEEGKKVTLDLSTAQAEEVIWQLLVYIAQLHIASGTKVEEPYEELRMLHKKPQKEKRESAHVISPLSTAG